MGISTKQLMQRFLSFMTSKASEYLNPVSARNPPYQNKKVLEGHGRGVL